MENDYSLLSDIELVRAWNHLETCVLSGSVENRMDLIMTECARRGIYAWDGDGNITKRD